MNKKILDKTISDNTKISDLIKSLGGAKYIQSYLLSKNKNITIESIYKWKKNGIPHRYRPEIKELSNNANIILAGDSFSRNDSLENKKAEFISNTDNKESKLYMKNNNLLYLLIFITAFLLIYIVYEYNNINDLKKKISHMEETLSAISDINYDKEINSFNKINKTQNDLIDKNSLKIDEMVNENNEFKKIIKEIDIDRPNAKIKYTYNQNPNYILLYLMEIKNNIKFSTPDLGQISFISNYLNNIVIPEEIKLALNSLDKLNKLELKGHKRIIERIDANFIKLNETINKNNEPDKSLLNNIKKLIKITKTDNKTFINKKNSYSIIINTINNYNYDSSLNELNLINNNGEFDQSIQDIKHLKILYQSVNLIIKWLIFEG
ncbi:MAG: hypothetical protein DBW65_00315 [Alphaproteobacteria bacterium]|nr:MAG: hypothetical protein DBW65_00315 [Alphaproteobacteria bacterium]